MTHAVNLPFSQLAQLIREGDHDVLASKKKSTLQIHVTTIPSHPPCTHYAANKQTKKEKLTLRLRLPCFQTQYLGTPLTFPLSFLPFIHSYQNSHSGTPRHTLVSSQSVRHQKHTHIRARAISGFTEKEKIRQKNIPKSERDALAMVIVIASLTLPQ